MSPKSRRRDFKSKQSKSMMASGISEVEDVDEGHKDFKMKSAIISEAPDEDEDPRAFNFDDSDDGRHAVKANDGLDIAR